MASTDNKIVVRGRGWFNQLKQVDQEPMERISQVVTTGDELELTILNDLTNRICYYDHGPAISLFEIETFCKQLCKNIKELKNDEPEIFSYMITAIARSKDDNYVIKNICMLILKPPYLVCLKFGNPDNVKYLIHLYNHVLYTLGDTNMRPMPYSAESLPAFKAMYENLKKDMLKAEESRIMKDFGGFRESLTKEIYDNQKDLVDSTDNTKQYNQAINILTDKVIESQKVLDAEAETAQTKFISLSESMFKVNAGKGKDKKGGKLSLPELHKNDE